MKDNTEVEMHPDHDDTASVRLTKPAIEETTNFDKTNEKIAVAHDRYLIGV